MYEVIRNAWGSEIELHHLPEPTLDSLLYFTLVCDEAAWISEIVLWRNGIKDLPIPCAEPEERIQNTKIQKIHNEKRLICYPNPADGSTKIVYPESKTPGHVIVFDFYGKQVFQTELPVGSTNLLLNLAGIPGGQYFVRAYWMNGMSSNAKLILKPF